jgi:hypothetical protein
MTVWLEHQPDFGVVAQLRRQEGIMRPLIQLVISDELIDDPDWSLVEAHLRNLDAAGEDALTLSVLPDEVPMLTVGGKLNELYTACAQGIDGNRVLFLIDPTKSTREMFVTFPLHTENPIYERDLVPLDRVLRAARWFCEHGTLNPELDWAEV